MSLYRLLILRIMTLRNEIEVLGTQTITTNNLRFGREVNGELPTVVFCCLLTILE